MRKGRFFFFIVVIVIGMLFVGRAHLGTWVQGYTNI